MSPLPTKLIMFTLLGKIDEKEKLEFIQLNEKKNSLEELLNTIDSKEEFIQRLITNDLKSKIFKDFKILENNYSDYSDILIKKYNWNIKNKQKIHISIETSEAYYNFTE